MKKRRIFLALVFVLLAMQFIQPSKVNPKVSPTSDFIEVMGWSEADGEMLKNSCYDCHSNETVWPWYSKIAPISYAVANHVNEGREHVNFSEWAEYNERQKAHILEECEEVIEEGEMPMSGYVMLHEEAKLTAEQKSVLVSLFKQASR